jgi:hypothetical protein
MGQRKQTYRPAKSVEAFYRFAVVNTPPTSDVHCSRRCDKISLTVLPS